MTLSRIHISLFFLLFTYQASAQTTFQYDVKGNQISSVYSGNNLCTDISNPPIDIAIDGNFNDWTNVNAVTTEGSAGLNFLSAYDDCSWLYIYVDGGLHTNFQLYIDSDYDAFGANEFAGSSWYSTGFNYMVENGILYRYTGSGTDWTWSQIGEETFEINNDKLEMSIPKNQLSDLNSTIRIAFATLDDAWNVVGKLPDANNGAPYSSLAENCGGCATGEGVCEGVQVSPIVFLQGPYDPNTGLMSDLLRSNGLLPLNEPFTGLGYTHIDGGGESVAPGVFTVAGADAIVDWVFVELRDKADYAIVQATRSALLQTDGDVVDVDGVSPVSFSTLGDDDYYVVVKHRNHLGAMSATHLALSGLPVVIDFTSNIADVFGAFNGIADLGVGFLGLYSGDYDLNGQVQNTDYNVSIPTVGVAGYLPGDYDLNGQVQNTDLQLKLNPNIGKGQPFGL